LSALFLVVSFLWVRRRISAASVGCYFMSVHLALASLATCWTITGQREEYPIALMNAAYMTIRPLDGDPVTWFPGWPSFDWQYKPLECYWICLLINFVWARRWLIRHFERLVERTHESSLPASPIHKRIVRSHPEIAGVTAKE
jgi:hypothetical protein